MAIPALTQDCLQHRKPGMPRGAICQDTTITDAESHNIAAQEAQIRKHVEAFHEHLRARNDAQAVEALKAASEAALKVFRESAHHRA